MILTVTPNPAIDLTWRVSRLAPGTTHRMPTGTSRAGGKGLNVARVLLQTGHEALVLATAGGATGDELRDDLTESGVPHRLITTGGRTRRSLAIVDAGDGTTTIFNELGEALAADESTAFAATAAKLGSSARAVAICGSLPLGFGADELASLVSLLVADRIPVVVDTSGPGILAAARAGAHALKPNQHELAEATGLDDPVEGARFLLGLGARLVLISLGADGLLVVAEAGAAVRARLPRALSGNATGAGDAAVAAIATALAGGGDLWSDSPAADAARVELARRATAWSAGAVLMPLAGEISADHVALADEVQITTIDEERR
ncbi:MAG: hexose kinase [Microcella sp.]|uniref:1-phosphofructokinase family hexose kinase n=1 Tax=Microcella sp. TaxID=1913979 RepID=UPI00271E668C|nr:hexose kinase [Microcella sp.]MDO8336942.1 hexose kinase [Microcella sp.]